MIEGVQIIGFDWRHIYVNDAIVRQSRYEKHELIGYTMMERYPGIEGSRVFQVLKECMETRVVKHLEIDFQFPDKRVAWFELSIQPIKEGLFILSIEITERKHFEERLRASEQEYRALIEQAIDAIFISDENGKYIDVNLSACRMVGYSKEELVQMSVADLLVPEDVKSNPPRFDLLREGRALSTIRRLKRKDGRVITVEINSKMLSSGKMLGMVRDITEKKETEEKIVSNLEQKVNERTVQLENKMRQLKESEEKFQKAFYASAAAISITRLSDSRIIDVNDAFVRMTGYSREELAGHTPVELGIITETEKRQEVLQQIQSEGHIRDLEFVIRNKSGKMLHVLLSLETIFLNNEKFALSIIYDITERKKAEEQLANVNKELEAFTYSVSHDLRAPLRSIIGYSQILEESLAGKLDDASKRPLAVIKRNAAKMNNLIDGLLSFSKLGKSDLRKTLVSTKSLVDDCIAAVNHSHHYNAKIIIRELFNVWADPEMLFQVWINLISNALKYSAKVPDPVVEIGGRQSGDEVVHYVKDNGVGFDMRYVEKLFGVFQRLHNSHEFEGTGIGLSIVKRVVTKHGGNVWAEAEPGRGAIFYFSLPMMK
jgi:PAS domain S-box-containing protein